MITIAAPVGFVCVGWFAIVARWVDARSLRAACLVLLLAELALTSLSLASASVTGCTSVFYLVTSWGHSAEYVASLALCCDELSCHFSSILLIALVLCFAFLSEYFDFDVNGVAITLMSALFSQLAFVFFCSFDLILLIFLWEWISMTSFFLILFWSMRVQTMKAAVKVFVVSQLGDLAFLAASASLYAHVGSSNFDAVSAHAGSFEHITLTGSTNVSLLSFWCLGFVSALWLKAAQVVFFPWLIDAMEAPVPISAQLHSSTLVIIGFYVIYRVRHLFNVCGWWQLATVYAGTSTAVVASVLGFFQDDAKRLLACSTASQLGYVMVLIGLGAQQSSLLLLTFCCCNKAYAFVWLGVIMERRGGLSDVRGLRRVRLLWAERCGLATAAANATVWPGAFVWHVKGLLLRGEALFSTGALVWGLLALTWFLGSLYIGRLLTTLWRCPGADVAPLSPLGTIQRSSVPSDVASSTVSSIQLIVLATLLCYGPLAALLIVPCAML